MTDKHIIIDVAGCEYFKLNRGFNCYKGYNCTDKECSNCYYKQLKRSEAQCEGMFVSHTDLEKKYKAKEQECERLTSTLTEIKEIAEENDELLQGYHKEWANNKLILQKINECEGNDELTK